MTKKIAVVAAGGKVSRKVITEALTAVLTLRPLAAKLKT